jgi:hypothetical protein
VVGQDLQALSQAVKSGNAADAQKALQSLQSDLRAHHGHGHHRHGRSAVPGAASGSADTLLTPPSSGSDQDSDG